MALRIWVYSSSIRNRYLSLLAGGLTLAVVAAAQSIDGEWIDSQGNGIRISQEQDRVRLFAPRWSIQRDTQTAQFDLSMDGRLAGTTFRLSQPGSRRVLELAGRLVRGRIRATLQGGELAQPVELILTRRVEAPPAVSARPPVRISLRTLQASARIGQWVPVEIGLIGNDGGAVSAPHDLIVSLSTRGGRPIPDIVRLRPNLGSVPAGVILNEGSVEVTTSAAGLKPARARVFGCLQGDVERIAMASTTARALADGRDVIPFTLTFLNKQGSRVTNGEPKHVGWNIEGVGTLSTRPGRGGQPQDEAIAPDECVARNELRSSEAGKVVVSAQSFNSSDSRTFYFIAPLSFVTFALVVLGAAMGAFVSGMRNYAAASRWAAKRWIVWLLSGISGGIALFLAYYYGAVRTLPQVPGGGGFAFLVGLIGGFLGAATLGRIADVVIPGRRTR